jgi:hypothetical protein
LVGVVLVGDAVFLMSGHVFSLGVTLPLGIACALLLLASRWNAIHRWMGATQLRRRAWRLAWGAFWVWIATVAAFWAALSHVADASAGAGTPSLQRVAARVLRGDQRGRAEGVLVALRLAPV